MTVHNHVYRWCNILDAMVNVQITNSVIQCMSQGSLYKQIEPSLAGVSMLFHEQGLFERRLT